MKGQKDDKKEKKKGEKQEKKEEEKKFLRTGPRADQSKVVQEVLADLKRNNFAAQLTRREAI